MSKPAFVIDHNWDWEVWNFPLVKFEILEQKEISAEDANKAIGATGSGYKFNENARKFVAVKLKYWMVSDGVEDSVMLKNAFQRGTAAHETELNYVLELDDTGKILGGEWSKDPGYVWGEGDASKEVHPDFLWAAVEYRGAGEDDDDMGGDDDNPYVSYKKARALLDCANDPNTCKKPGTGTGGAGGMGGAAGGGGTGGATGGPSSCVDHCGAQSEDKSCWCDSGCKTYGDCCSDYVDACTGNTGGGGGTGGASTGGAGGGTSEPTGCTEALCGTANDAKEDGKTCYCDSQCASYGDCCSNKVEVCGE
jgi:hypothetical protein